MTITTIDWHDMYNYYWEGLTGGRPSGKQLGPNPTRARDNQFRKMVGMDAVIAWNGQAKLIVVPLRFCCC